MQKEGNEGGRLGMGYGGNGGKECYVWAWRNTGYIRGGGVGTI